KEVVIWPGDCFTSMEVEMEPRFRRHRGGMQLRKSAILFGLAPVAIAMFLLSNPAAAAHWGKLKLNYCNEWCQAHWSAILWDIAPGVDWPYACERSPHPKFGRPPNHGDCDINVNVWGNWYTHNDSACGDWCLRKNWRKR